MASLLNVTQKQRTASKRNKITIPQKRWLLSAHLLFIAVWLGSAFCSLALNITALLSTDPHLLNATYVLTDILDHTIVRGGAGGTLLTGILFAVLTQWGLVRFYWINAKEIISILCVAIDFIGIHWNEQIISLTTTQGFQAFSNPLYLTNRTLLIIGILFRLIALAGIIVISVFKPWGQHKKKEATL